MQLELGERGEFHDISKFRWRGLSRIPCTHIEIGVAMYIVIRHKTLHHSLICMAKKAVDVMWLPEGFHGFPLRNSATQYSSAG